ncbi:MAG: FAD-binding oxidoreductase [Myxococcaceae bacterium]|nr:FAD-binding oxidoreductase [Myxococcaceae bacterium]
MMKPAEPTLHGWGRLKSPGREVHVDELERAPDAPLSRGLGRSYGDSSLPPPGATAINTVRADRVLKFDEITGVFRAEAGLALHELNRLTLPRGWFTPVTPGTHFVTLGGMVAADVHGKNHHVAGCFGSHVTRLKLRVADGRIVECGPDLERDLFRATVGGMGLTGHILEVEFGLVRVPSPWVLQETERATDIDDFIAKLKEAAARWPMTLGWIDCLSTGKNLGRGIIMRGRWAEPHEAPPYLPREPMRVPWPQLEAPAWALNRFTVGAFNTVYYRSHPKRVKTAIVSHYKWIYPLDSIRNWNMMYGRRGFSQYQCVLPVVAGPQAARRFLELLTSRGGAESFLCVIKDCGPEGLGLLSFPKKGISIALDIPVRDGMQALVDALNEHVIREGGRVYLAKDAFTRAEHFRAMEPRLEEFRRIRKQWDPGLKLRSAQSIRLFGDPA